MENAIFWNNLEESLPAVFSRQAIPNLTGNLIASSTMANLDAQRLGPSVKVRIGKLIGYERSNFVAWLRNRSKTIDATKLNNCPSVPVAKNSSHSGKQTDH